MTLVTNPLTIGFWLWLAYHFGVLILGEPEVSLEPPTTGVLAWVAQFGWPTVLGMGVFAVGGAVVGYFLVKLVWRVRVWVKRRRHL